MIEDKTKCNQSHLWRMESIVEDVEDQRQTEGSPANTQSDKKLVGCDVMRHSRGLHQFHSVYLIRSQHDDDIDSEAKYSLSIDNLFHKAFT